MTSSILEKKMIKYCCDWCGNEVDDLTAKANTVVMPKLYEDYFFGCQVNWSLHTCKDPRDYKRYGGINSYIICDKCLTKIWRLRNVDD